MQKGSLVRRARHSQSEVCEFRCGVSQDLQVHGTTVESPSVQQTKSPTSERHDKPSLLSRYPCPRTSSESLHSHLTRSSAHAAEHFCAHLCPSLNVAIAESLRFYLASPTGFEPVLSP
jgi:hypothetical protein